MGMWGMWQAMPVFRPAGALFARAWALVLLSPLLLLVQPAQPLNAGELACRDISYLYQVFLQSHIHHRRLTPELQALTLDNFLRRLDPQHTLLLAGEVKTIKRDLRNVFQETRKGDCSRLRGVHALVVERSREAEAFVRAFAGDDDYVIDESAELIIDVKERGHPEDTEAQEALLRTLVHFQVSNYYHGGDLELAEARRRVIRRYELRTKHTAEMTEEDIYAIFLGSFANSLDPHTEFYSARDYEDFRIRIELSLEGIGVELRQEDGFSVVHRVLPGGATDRADALEPDDRIISVAQEGEDPVDIIDMSLRDVVRLIRGKKGTRVHLGVLRGEQERLNVVITRDKIDLAEQAARLHIEDVEVDGRTLKLGMIELPSFYGGTSKDTSRLGSDDVLRLLEEAKQAQVEGILLDLSRNGGGLLDDAVRISGFFIDRGAVVAVRMGNRGEVHPDPEPGVVYDGPLVILTSRLSASASEILAGAMKDYRRAVIVGDDHTFGKGTVQNLRELARAELGALKITSAMFYRPEGRSTQLAGVNSDVVLPSLWARPRFGERVHENALPESTIESVMGRVPGAERAGRHRIDPELLDALRLRSAARVAESEGFAELREIIAEREQDDGRLRLADINSERQGQDEQEGDTEAESEEAGDAAAAEQEEDRPRQAGGAEGQDVAATGGAAAATGAGAAGAVGAEPAGEDADPSDESEDEDAPNLRQREALHILADLVVLSG